MKIGTYYYPEQWPREQWERDFDNIASMGLEMVHMGEFAWFTMEPEPGKIQLDWLAECVEMARKRHLEVILCTPTAAPPIWLSEQFPETLPTDEHGTPGRFGGRRHYTPTSPALHEATRRIVSALADRFGNDPTVVGWQIDNEYSGNFDQSEHTHTAFQQWLSRKYGDIAALNSAWGNQFWNTYYTDFDQILMPPRREPGYANPHHCLDASRFWSWAYANFNKIQADILRPKIGDRFLTTNFMPFHMDCNPGDMVEDLSLFSWDSYPVTGWDKNPKDQNYRIADPNGIGFTHDLMRSYHERWALMELQPGQVNWTGVPVLLHPGAVRLWIWTAFAHGAEFVTTYRYRQPRFGVEMFHHGLMEPDGTTQSLGGRQFVQVIDELQRLDLTKRAVRRPAAVAKAPPPAPRKRSRYGPVSLPEAVQTVPESASGDVAPASVGLLFDFEQLWWYRTLPQAKRWDQPRFLTIWYGAISRLGLRVEILHPDRPWPTDLRAMVVPGLQMVDDALVKRLDEYAVKGGHLVLTCRTGLMDRNGQLWEGRLAEPILPLIGGEIEAYDGLPEDTFGQLEMDGKRYPWGVWGDLLYAEPETKPIAKYADQFYTGATAVTQHKRGEGVVTYCGVYSESNFIDALMERVATQAKLPTLSLPARVQVIQRGAYFIALNYQDVPFDVPASPGATFVVGSRRLEPAGVAVWEE